ncbi:NEL-type E3 ubiquitin ligase domain-containing protein [Pseudomonas trivialis]|uniref:RING-type E3 ubiquitin transferase n=1 Tax=Pseudomonas trivialis TaxID=200450 RepID=A0A0R2ZJZ2_9PSED|nr:NEL-type E3 ubiquitin ligase domain-containing protein [Pseudomonas trivialis]KRP61010.1 hypothetical protein TU79_09000 [Pseudomonas trivialis]SDS42785.1 C-terminal novel E3 ligase, LRR-interacting [Pseudomonas trivialis]
MTPYTPLHGLSGNLQSSDAWARQQALELIQRTVTQAMQALSAQEQADYLRLHRESQKALADLETEKQALIDAFKTESLAQLRGKLDGRDPQLYRFNTTYLEKREHPFPWDPPARAPEFRPRRAYEEWRYDLHTKSMTLWEAACVNFGFTHSIVQDSGFSLAESSEIVGPGAPLDTLAFIRIARELNLGDQLQTRIQTALAANSTLHGRFLAATTAMTRFELLESWRLRATTGLTRPLYDALLHTLEAGDRSLKFDTLSLEFSPASIPLVQGPDATPLPLFLIRVASLGVVSYFPSRPGGAFVYHNDAKAAHASLRQQLKDSQQQQDLGWFSRQFSLTGLSALTSLLKKQPRPESLSWLAGLLYDGFHKAFPGPSLDSLHFVTTPAPGKALSLVKTLVSRYIQRYRSDLSTLATTRSEADWQALKNGVSAIGAEVLQLLLTPMPGGVTGLNRIMQLAVLGSMTYSLGQGVDAAVKGESSGFASTLADVADLAISGRLITVAGRAHHQRMLNYLDSLGNPRKVTRTDGVDELWRPNAQPYAIPRQHLLDGRSADALGLYTVEGKTYARLSVGDQTRVVEISYDTQHLRYVLKHVNGGRYTPPIIFEPTAQAWVFDLKNAHTLTDLQLLKRMLPNGLPTPADADLEQMLRSTATTRTTLDNVWSAQPAPLDLIEGVRRLQADQVIRQIVEHFHEPGYLPPHGDALVFGLLTQLPNWPGDTVINVRDEQGVLIETYSKTAQPPTKPHTVQLTRQEDGRYADVDNQRLPAGTVDPLMRLIMRQQPAKSQLGKSDTPTLTEDQRINTLRGEVAALGASERATLFTTAVNYAGYDKTELIPPPAVRRYLPLKATSTSVPLTPVLKKLRDLNAPLSAISLARLLEQQPLTPRQQQDYLQHGTLPQALVDLLDRQRTALRIDAVIDGLYHAREFASDTDQWAREFASALVRNTLKRPFVVTDIDSGKTYTSSGPEDPTVELRHYGDGDYRAYDMRNGGEIAVSPQIDSFYLAIGSVLQPHERQLLGMNSANDAKGLRKTLGDLMSKQRSPQGFVSLVNGSLAQYEQPRSLPPNLKPAANGIFTFNARHYLALLGSLYRIVFDKSLLKWRLVHPHKSGVNTPTLEHNGEGAWRLSSDDPMAWDDHSLLQRLGNHTYAFTRDVAGKILALTDTPAQALRQVHCTARAAPPLLTDTCKRVKIDEQIQLFIQALRTDPSAPPARPELQLLVLTGMSGWPTDHVLQIVDDQQQVLKQYPTPHTPKNATVVQVTEQDYKGGKLLASVVANDAICNGLLAEQTRTSAERLFKLVKKIIAFIEQNPAPVFESLYARNELHGSAQEKRIKAHYPKLPTSAAKAILGQATPRELKQLHDKNRVGLRLAEQARLTGHDLRLNRAYEGLLLASCANADSDRITLYLLKSLPDWPKNLRIDVHQDSYHGALLQSAGHMDGTVRRLVRTRDGYQPYDSAGKPSGEHSRALLPALLQYLSASERSALSISDNDDLSPWREQIVALALGRRVEIKGELGLPHLQPWMQPPMGVDHSFLAYPIFGARWPFGGNRPPDLVARVLALYPSFSANEARTFIRSLDLSEPAALIELDRRQAEYQAFDTELTRWAEAPNETEDANDPLGIHLGVRRFIAQRLRQAWRRDGQQHYLPGLFHVASLELQLDDISLPPAFFLAGLTGFEHIEYLRLSSNAFPVGADLFLQKFPGLRALKIDSNMSELPKAITDMTQLQQLDLSYNNLVLTEEAAVRLANMPHLEYVDLSHNRLAIAPDVSRMQNLQSLDLRNSEISQWPTGTWQLTHLSQLHLEDNLIDSVPEQIFTTPGLSEVNRNTFLHGNPLSEASRQHIEDYRRSTGIDLGGPMLVAQHTTPETDDFNQWLTGVPAHEITERSWLWEQLRANEEVRADDVFQVLADLPKTFAYTRSDASRQALTVRVWTLLTAMGESTQLRNAVCLNTYGAGSCGDSVLLAFTNMELEHRIHQAKSMRRTHESDRALIALSTGRFYLNQLDHISDKFIHAREMAGLDVDQAEVTIYFRAQLAKEFNLPFYPLELLYTVERYVTQAVLDDARAQLRKLGKSPALQEWLLMETFWIEYLANSHPHTFTAVRENIEYKVQALEKELPDKQSDLYLERRQSLIDLEKEEHNRLVRQLTVATQAALQRA